MKFDIAAKIVGSKQRAWVVHAGRAQMNYPEFVENDIVFLEAPYIKLDDRILYSKRSIRQAIRQSVAMQEHHSTTGSIPPSDALTDYDDEPFRDGGLQSFTGSISRLYGQARVGDLIIVPGRDVHDGLSRPVIRIGEIASDFDPLDTFKGRRRSSYFVPYRKIRWLNTVPRKSISLYLERKIGKPPAVREIKIARDTEDILKFAYASYVYDGSSSSSVLADRYDGSDFLYLNRSSDLIAFLASGHAVFSQNDTSVIRIRNIKDFTNEHFAEASIDNIEIDFASPGFWRIVGGSASLAAFVALGIAVLSSGLSADDLISGIEVVNSVSPSDGTADALQDSMNLLLKSIEKLSLENALKDATEARKVIGLQSSTKLVD
jgi:hypothetical protein